jgi:hypothetical protein
MSLVLPALLWASSALAEQAISYDRQIRPILSDKCFACHGPDASSRKAELRLDIATDGQTALVPGKPEESELIRRITTADPDDRMPPPEADEALTPEEVALVTGWIAQGAKRTAHWAFQTPVRPGLPAVSRADWVRNPIDAFVLARLDAEGLTPSPEADRLTLLRRLSLDLTGLPPSLEEIERVTHDDSEGWYTALVDRLLASPHYGEHWARHWLDAAQYADSDGFEKDARRQVWAWRDWVIRAFNGDKPYDAFVVEQIAGDRLPEASLDQRVATGFLRNSMINEEGGIDPEQFRMEALFNRMDLVGRGVLGLTVACAQCHSHKFDPLTHAEYYGMLAFLNDADEANIAVYTETEETQRAALRSLIAEIEAGVKADNTDWPARMAEWEEGLRAEPEPAWETLALAFDDNSTGGQKFLPQEDGSYLGQGFSPSGTSPKMSTTTTLQKITAIRIDVMTDPNLPRGGPGRSKNGTFALSEVQLRTTTEGLATKDYEKWTAVPIASAIADVNPPQRLLGPDFPSKENKIRYTGPIDLAIDGKVETAWTSDIDPARRNGPRAAVFKLAEPLAVAPGMTLGFQLQQSHGGWNNNDKQTNNLGRFRIQVTDAEVLPARVIPVSIEAILDTPRESRTPAQQDALFSYWRESQPEFHAANQRIDGLWQAFPEGASQLVLQARGTPRTTHRLERGDFLSPAEEVAPFTPAFLNPMPPAAPRDRLAFAQWLVSADAPTTARAYVNRVWQRHFGEGLVTTTADLGMQGDPPSHPELLDWLAVEFMKSGWRVKDLHRLIVTSSAYRQASAATPELRERDPYNRLLARGARFRVEGETVRDVTLAASGLLNGKVGGPSVYPPAPEFLFLPPASYGTKTWEYDTGADKYRRALYTFRFRSVPFPALQVFDTPSGESPCTRRERSNSPLQALTTLNEPLFFESAVKLAESALHEGGATDRDRIIYAFRRCITREPAPEEVDAMLVFLEGQRARLSAGELDPGSILDVAGTAWADDPNTLAAWALAARVILNLDETIVRQ